MNLELIEETREFIRTDSKVKLLCKNGHTTHKYVSNLKKGSGCKRCACVRNAVKLKHPIEFVIQKFLELNLTPMFDIYKDNRTPLPYYCNNHPQEIQEVLFKQILQGFGACRKCMAERMSEDKNVNWDGGTTKVADYLRDGLKEWTLESLRKCNFQCVITGKSKNLQVHHLMGFMLIVREAIESLKLKIKLYKNVSEFNDDELRCLREEVIQLHRQYGLGVVLTKEVHKQFHSIYGHKNNTASQFIEFCKLYYNMDGDSLCA